jgi:ABC-type transporter Mla subunit MlaD
VRRFGLTRNQAMGLSVVVAGTIVWVFAFIGGFAGIFAASTYTVKANFNSVENIVLNDPVRINGVDVGTVDSVSASGNGNAGTVKMSVQSRYHIYNDASASMVWRTILGGNDAIAIDPGTIDAGKLRGPIPASRTNNQVELDQVLLPFHDGAKPGLQTSFKELGPALSNRFDLANDLNLYRGIVPAANVGGGALRGEVQDTDLRHLVRNAGQAAQAMSVGTGAATTRQFVQSAASTLQAFGGNPENLKGTIRTFATVWADGENLVWRQYNGLLDKLDPIVHTLQGSVPQIVPALDQFNPTLANAHQLLSDANPLVHKLSPAVDDLASTAKVGVPLIRQLNAGLTDLGRTTLPGLAAKYPEEGGKAPYQLIGSTFIGLGAIMNNFNQDGETANLTAGLEKETGQEAQFLPCTVDFSQSASPLDLLACQSLSGALQAFFSGGTDLLQNLIARPGGQAIFAPLLKSAQQVQAKQNRVEQTLRSIAPKVASFLFDKHGSSR